MNKSCIIFWPNDIANLNDLQLTNDKYLIIGHKISDFKYVVIYLISYTLESYKRYKEAFVIDKELQLLVIGLIDDDTHQNDFDDKLLKFDSATLLLTINGVSHPFTLIVYKPPSTKILEYYSDSPIIIDTIWANSMDKFNSKSIKRKLKDDSEIEYSKKILQHSQPTNGKDTINLEIKECLKYMNLNKYSKSKISSITNNTQQTHNSSQQNSLINKLSFRYWLGLIIPYTSLFYSFVIQNMCQICKIILNYQFFKTISLKSCSYSFNQINFRLLQLYNLPSQYSKMKRANYETEISLITGTKVSPTEYIKFYNTLWLINNDILMGLMISNFIMLNLNFIESKIVDFINVFQVLMNQLVNWLTNSPAGFKLNNELSTFFGDLILWVMGFWNTLILDSIISRTNGLGFLRLFLKFISLMSACCGFSMFISIVLDTLSLTMFHLHCFYFASTRVYKWQSNVLQSLFRLFYGKKFNPLRNRVDSNNYEFDQLLFGIIIFTILVYLLPTVLAFYMTFVACRLINVLCDSLLTFVLIAVNHLPVVVILLKLKHQDRLPGGITMTLDTVSSLSSSSKLSVFQLHTLPLTFAQIFESHKTSLINYNIINYLEYHKNIKHSSVNDEDIDNLMIENVYNNWKRINLPNTIKNIITGDFISTFDYKKLF